MQEATMQARPGEHAPLLQAALHLLERLETAGYAAYIVGGFVRDTVMRTPQAHRQAAPQAPGEPERLREIWAPAEDIDLATNCPMPVLETLCSVCADVGRNRDFHILLVENEGFRFEVAQLRTRQTAHSPGEALQAGPAALHDDLAVRDFRINAMALDARLCLYDPFGGREDLEAGRLTCVHSPADRFAEDPLRMLRAVRLAARFGLELGPAERRTMRDAAASLATPAVERIWAELAAMCAQDGPRCATAMALLAECGLLGQVLPEVDRLRTLHHNPAMHPEGASADSPGSVFDHILAALRMNTETDATLNLALLFHDIGKGITARRVPGQPWSRFYGHDTAGAPLMRQIGTRLRMPRQLVETLCYCIRSHMLVYRFPEMRPHKVLAVVSDPRWPLLRRVNFCDDACRTGRFALPQWQARMAVADTVLARQQAGAAVSGRAVMEVCAIPSGPLVGKIQRLATARLLTQAHCSEETVRRAILSAYAQLRKA